jgi:hypothetical protein
MEFIGISLSDPLGRRVEYHGNYSGLASKGNHGSWAVGTTGSTNSSSPALAYFTPLSQPSSFFAGSSPRTMNAYASPRRAP